MTRTFSDGHPKVLPACNFLSQYYFYNIFLQKSCRFSLQTLTKFEAAKTGSGVGFLRLTAVWSQPYYAACVNVSRNDRAMPFSARALLALWKLLNKKHFLWRWYCGRKQIEMRFIGVCTLIVNEYASQLFSQTFFRIVSACWAASLRKFLKGKSDAYK